MILNSLLLKQQINFKVCRAHLFSLFIFPVLFLFVAVLHIFFILPCALSLSCLFKISCVIFCFFLFLVCVYIFFSLEMDKNKVTATTILSWTKKKKNKPTTKIWRKRKMQTDLSYRFCVYVLRSLSLSSRLSRWRFNKTATIHIVHRKTQNKSHVRAHNVLQTSYITCSFAYLGTKMIFLFLFRSALMLLHRDTISCALFLFRSYLREREREWAKNEKNKKNWWFFMTQDGQQIICCMICTSVGLFHSFLYKVAHANCWTFAYGLPIFDSIWFN